MPAHLQERQVAHHLVLLPPGPKQRQHLRQHMAGQRSSIREATAAACTKLWGYHMASHGSSLWGLPIFYCRSTRGVTAVAWAAQPPSAGYTNKHLRHNTHTHTRTNTQAPAAEHTHTHINRHLWQSSHPLCASNCKPACCQNWAEQLICAETGQKGAQAPGRQQYHPPTFFTAGGGPFCWPPAISKPPTCGQHRARTSLCMVGAW